MSWSVPAIVIKSDFKQMFEPEGQYLFFALCLIEEYS